MEQNSARSNSKAGPAMGSSIWQRSIGDVGVQEIEQLGEIRFHAVGDSGSGHADDAEKVADDMATDYKPDAGALNPAFLFHLGDVVYGPDKDSHYGERFYRPYRHYPGKIIAIPGNHDGEAKTPADTPSLKAFQANFCAAKAAVPPQAAGSGDLPRNHDAAGRVLASRTRPSCASSACIQTTWKTRDISKAMAATDKSQLEWLTKTLRSIANKDKKVSVHRDPSARPIVKAVKTVIAAAPR